MIEHGAELIVNRLEVHWRIRHTVFVRRFHDGILPMEYIHRLYIPYSLISEIRQNFLLDDATLCDPSILPNVIL